MKNESMQYDSVEKLLEEFSHIRLATKEDNQAILDFYDNESMDAGGESISFSRGPDFFSFYELTSKKYWPFIFLNKDQSIGGVGAILRHIRDVDGVPTPLAYFCDLRISRKASRITKLQWRKFFPEITKTLRNLSAEERCISAYTAILSANEIALNTLTRSGRGVTYRPLGEYKVHSFLSTGLLKSKKYETKEISKEDFVHYYKEINKNTFLSEDPNFTLNNLESLSAAEVYLGVFYGDQVVAVCRPVLGNKTRKIKIQNMNSNKKVLGKILKLLSRPIPDSSGKLETLDLTFLSFKKDRDSEERERIIESLQYWIKSNKLLGQIHIYNFTDSNNEIDTSFLKRGISICTKGIVFEIHPEGDNALLPEKDFRFEGAFL